MDREHVKSAPDNAKSADKNTARKPAQGEVKFDKPLGSSHNDKADIRDVTREAAEKSK